MTSCPTFSTRLIACPIQVSVYVVNPLTVTWRGVLLPARCFTRAINFRSRAWSLVRHNHYGRLEFLVMAAKPTKAKHDLQNSRGFLKMVLMVGAPGARSGVVMAQQHEALCQLGARRD